MKVSKISSKATYHKCIKELNDWQYLKYKPSYNPFKGSLVYLFNTQYEEEKSKSKYKQISLFNFQPTNQNEDFNHTKNQTSAEQALVSHHTKIGTSTEQALVPYLNIYKHNKQNIVNLDKQTKKSEIQNLNELEKKEKSSAKKERSLTAKNKRTPFPFSEGEGGQRTDEATVPPNQNEVKEYFTTQNYSSIEGEKFYNYFQSNGWLVGGKAKMKDWKAAADNWIINAKKFAEQKSVKPKAKHLHTKQNKNYNEPL